MKELEVCAGVIIKEDFVLIGKRKAQDRFGGKWEFPGGKVEEGELPEDCLIRELKEELNIDVTSFKDYYSYVYRAKNLTLIIHAFIVNNYIGNMKNYEHDKLNWIKPQDFAEYDILDGDMPIMKKLLVEKKAMPLA